MLFFWLILIQCIPFITLCLRSIGLDHVLSICVIMGQFSFKTSGLDRQHICVNMQLKSSENLLKLNVCVLKSYSTDGYAITCDVTAYHLVHFVSVWVINKCPPGIDFFLTSKCTV